MFQHVNLSVRRYVVVALLIALVVPLAFMQPVHALSDGTDDADFYSNLGSGFGGAVYVTAVQTDGKVLVGGFYTTFDGNTRNYLVRLNADGTEDTSFYTNLGTGFNERIYTVEVQTDGDILVGGEFTSFNGNTRNRLVRLNSDGTEDTAFYTNLGTAFNSGVYNVEVQTDGDIVVAGNFTTLDGNARNYLVRLNSDGTEDGAFYTNLGTGFNDYTYNVALQTDGDLVVGGAFTGLNGNTRNSLVRLNSDGTEDTAFYTNVGTGFNGGVWYSEIQDDGDILVGGEFTQLDGNNRQYLVRLNSDGTEDTAFYTNLGTAFDSDVNIMLEQSDGTIIVAGFFSNFNSNARNGMVQLNSDGTEIASFYTNLGTGGFGDSVWWVSEHSDGLIAGGEFTTLGGNTRNRLVRLTSASTSGGDGGGITPVNGSVEILDFPEFCSSDSFQVYLSATDATSYIFSVDDPLFLGADWQPFNGELTIDVPTDEMLGVHTVYAKFRSRTRNTSVTVTDSVECTEDHVVVPVDPVAPESCEVPEDFPHSPGVVLKGSDTPEVYLFGEDGCRHWYEDEAAFYAYWNSFDQLTMIDSSLLEQLELGSSIKAPESEESMTCEVTLYTEPDFRGTYQKFTNNSHDFRTEPIGNDTVSSLRISEGSDCSVTLFEHIDYEGVGETFSENDRDLSGNVIQTDNASSLSF